MQMPVKNHIIPLHHIRRAVDMRKPDPLTASLDLAKFIKTSYPRLNTRLPKILIPRVRPAEYNILLLLQLRQPLNHRSAYQIPAVDHNIDIPPRIDLPYQSPKVPHTVMYIRYPCYLHPFSATSLN